VRVDVTGCCRICAYWRLLQDQLPGEVGVPCPHTRGPPEWDGRQWWARHRRRLYKGVQEEGASVEGSAVGEQEVAEHSVVTGWRLRRSSQV